MRNVLISLVFLLCGCSGNSVNWVAEPGYACELPGKNVRIELVRLHFNIPDSFLGKKCSKFVDYGHAKKGDWFSMAGGVKSMEEGSVRTEVFTVTFKVTGGKGRVGLEYHLSPQNFIDFKIDKSMEGGPGLHSVSWVEKPIGQCARLEYFSSNRMYKTRRIEYWCWPSDTDMPVPVGVFASEVVSSGGQWVVDLEEKVFTPIFSSITLYALPKDYLIHVLEGKLDACNKNIKNFEERGVAWLTGEALQRNWTPVFLEMCGYNAP